MFDDRLLWALLGAAIAVVTAWLVARHLQSAHEEMHRTCLNMASEAARMLQTTSQLTEHKAALSDLQAVVVGLNRSVTNLVAMQTGRTLVPKPDQQYGEGAPSPVSRDVEIVAPPTGGLVQSDQKQRLVSPPPTALAKPT